MQNWKDLYTELADFLKKEVAAIKYIDLWHNQVNFLSEEHPFPTPAVFLNFRIINTQDLGEKVQNVKLQVDTFIFYETFADTYQDSWNQSSAFEFLDLLNDSYATLHGTSGKNYSNMRRIGFAPVDTGGAGNLYIQSYECTLIDYAAMKTYNDSTIADLDVEQGIPEIIIDEESEYKL